MRCSSLQALILNFEKEVALSENVGKRTRGSERSLVTPLNESLGNFAFEASRKANQPLSNAGQETSC